MTGSAAARTSSSLRWTRSLAWAISDALSGVSATAACARARALAVSWSPKARSPSRNRFAVCALSKRSRRPRNRSGFSSVQFTASGIARCRTRSSCTPCNAAMIRRHGIPPRPRISEAAAAGAGRKQRQFVAGSMDQFASASEQLRQGLEVDFERRSRGPAPRDPRPRMTPSPGLRRCLP